MPAPDGDPVAALQIPDLGSRRNKDAIATGNGDGLAGVQPEVGATFDEAFQLMDFR